jgi:hypothetical protein
MKSLNLFSMVFQWFGCADIKNKNKNFKKYRFDIFSIEKHSLKTS